MVDKFKNGVGILVVMETENCSYNIYRWVLNDEIRILIYDFCKYVKKYKLSTVSILKFWYLL